MKIVTVLQTSLIGLIGLLALTEQNISSTSNESFLIICNQGILQKKSDLGGPKWNQRSCSEHSRKLHSLHYIVIYKFKTVITFGVELIGTKTIIENVASNILSTQSENYLLQDSSGRGYFYEWFRVNEEVIFDVVSNIVFATLNTSRRLFNWFLWPKVTNTLCLSHCVTKW